MDILDQSLIKGRMYRADLESLSRIKACLVLTFIGMLVSKYIASQGFGSLLSCVDISKCADIA